MRILGLIVAIMACALFVCSAGTQDQGNSSSPAKAQEPADKVQELQRERIATLKDVADAEAKLYQSGNSSSEAVLEAKVLVCEAELDADEQGVDRIARLMRLVEAFKDYEEVAKARKMS